MDVLVCVSEYYPYGSGIANVAYNVVERLNKKNINCKVCSPTGPHIKLGNRKLIQNFGRVGLIHYWDQVRKYLENKENFDLVWLHQPLFIRKTVLPESLITMHITSYGVYKQIRKSSNYPIPRKIYKHIAYQIEKFSLSQLNLKNIKFSADSLQVCKELKFLGIDNEKISYIPNGVDTNLFKPVDKEKKQELREYFGIPKQDLVLLSVGNLTLAKNPLKLIEIYSLVEKKYENISLVVVGTGELENVVKREAQKRGINVVFLGQIDYSRIHKVYACSDIYIMTSRNEGMPLTLLEAMSSGLPCIVSNIPSLSYPVNNAKAGITINLDKEYTAADKIINLLNSNLSKFEKNARNYAEKNFDWKKITKKYINEFEKIIK